MYRNAVSLTEKKRCLRILHAWLAGILQHVTAHRLQLPYDQCADHPPNFLYPSQVCLLFHMIKYSPQPHESEHLLAEKALHTACKLAGLLKNYAQLRAFIVGLDVAGDERNSPPRLFCPIFNNT